MPLNQTGSRHTTTRQPSGLSAVEMCSGAIILVIICLALLDMGVLVIASSMNDSVAKNAARAAANHTTENLANQAATRAVTALGPSPIVASVNLASLEYDLNHSGMVKARTRMTVNLPVPFPGYQQITFDAQAVEPLVAKR